MNNYRKRGKTNAKQIALQDAIKDLRSLKGKVRLNTDCELKRKRKLLLGMISKGEREITSGKGISHREVLRKTKTW